MGAARQVEIGGQLEALAGRVSRTIEPTDTAIVVTVTDTGDRFTVRGLGGRPSVTRDDDPRPAGVHVAVSAEVIDAV